jgi:hypothetical protein
MAKSMESGEVKEGASKPESVRVMGHTLPSPSPPETTMKEPCLDNE